MIRVTPAIVFPAHAGMDRENLSDDSSASAYSPRTRGWTEGSKHETGIRQRIPRARGDGPLRIASSQMGDVVFPAHAGMDRQ